MNSLTSANRGRFWTVLYPASFVSVPHARMENCYWIQIYKLEGCIRKGGPLCDLRGPWFKPSGWPAIWWNLNTQMPYWPFPAGNRIEMAERSAKKSSAPQSNEERRGDLVCALCRAVADSVPCRG